MSSDYCTHFRQVIAMMYLMVLAIFATTSGEVTTSGEWTLGTYITGYWDCCKPSCSWPNKGSVNKPVRTCDATSGATVLDPNAASVCHGGSSASCSDQQPWVVNDGLSMGFAAAAVGGTHGLSGDANCGQCFELQFVDTIHDPWSWGGWGGSHPELVGKIHVVQVTNIGYDVNGEHSFDLQIPGAGQGAFTTGCNRQFPGYVSGDFDCDLAYGGCTDVSGCSRLPSVLQKGCEWRFDWFKWLVLNGQTNNPYIKFRRVQCPTELTDISGTLPLDDHMYPVHTGKTNASRTTSGFLSRSTTTSTAVIAPTTTARHPTSYAPATTTGAMMRATTTAVTVHCSEMEEDCRETKCCMSPTMQCYQKNAYWAACLSSCLPGQIRLEDPLQYQTPWSCDMLGTLPTTTVVLNPSSTSTATTKAVVTQPTCSDAYVDCRSSGCCNDPAMKCYEKNNWWGQCLESCTPGIHLDEAPQWQTPWNCNVFGATTTLTTTSGFCADAGTDCRSTACCQNPTLQCYEKNDWWGQCLESCTPGLHLDEAPQWQTPWSCRVLSTQTRTECADASMDCRSSQCCKHSGMTCYRKDEGWAACLSSCSPGQVRREDPPQYQTPWSCEVLEL